MTKAKSSTKAVTPKAATPKATPTAVTTKPALEKAPKPIVETTRRDLVQTSLNERNTADHIGPDRFFERVREEDVTA